MKVNEIFYSLQGEGYWTGRPAVFVRFSGCNLSCPFCDTDFKQYEELAEEEVVQRVEMCGHGCKFVVLTGGEPTLQATIELVNLLHEHSYYIAMETNGTREVPDGVDWVTCSPKSGFCQNGDIRLRMADEVKVVYQEGIKVDDFGIRCQHRYLQPCDMGFLRDNRENMMGAIKYCLEHPDWRISLQTQKIMEVR